VPTWYLRLDRKAPIPSTHLDWYSLARFEPQLAEIARSLKLKPLLEFFSCGSDDLPEQVDVEVREQWFAPGEALKTVSGLLDYLRKTDSRSLQDTRLLQELDEFERALTEIDSSGLKFHIAIDY
jgi:hypothetical protein